MVKSEVMALSLRFELLCSWSQEPARSTFPMCTPVTATGTLLATIETHTYEFKKNPPAPINGAAYLAGKALACWLLSVSQYPDHLVAIWAEGGAVEVAEPCFHCVAASVHQVTLPPEPSPRSMLVN